MACIRPAALVLALILAGLCCGCSGKKQAPRQVVVYTALDEVYSAPILADFERRTGIKVLAKYDAETAKTTTLVTSLIMCREKPECDVFWSNEVVQTHRLAEMGLLAAYDSPEGRHIPAAFRDGQNRWTGFAARARVLVYNTRLVSPDQAPRSLADLADPKWKGKIAIAKPLFGTTLTQMAALRQAWGKERLAGFLDGLLANDVALCPGNAAVRDMVGAGERAVGLTDTDDANVGILDGKPIRAVFLDEPGGSILIPNTAAVVANCPHPDEARLLMDFLLSSQVEQALAQCSSAQIPLRDDLSGLKTPWTDDGKAQVFDVQAAAGSLDEVIDLLRQKDLDR